MVPTSLLDTLRDFDSTTEDDIGKLAHLLLIPLLTALVLIAVLTGLGALRSTPRAASFVPRTPTATAPAWPEPVAPEIRGLPPVTDAVPIEAAAARPASAHRLAVPLRVVPAGDPGVQELELVVLDAATGVRRATRPLGENGEIVFDRLPAGALVLALALPDRSARYRELVRVPIELPAHDVSAPPAVEVSLPVATAFLRLVLECTAEGSDPHPLATPVTVGVRRPDAPEWRGPMATVPCPRTGGGRSAPIELGPLGVGEYSLDVTGFEPAAGAALTFRIPDDRELILRGAPR